ncbi:hypothetical protein [Anaerotardibacter muris]|uniref:hypothetical protein n=1 Tax=Anaerotardibacter muris TaxID=2941505 RepID=UPI00203D7CD6|nr:hypothetical protein [Anaerotardibacter muris]
MAGRQGSVRVGPVSILVLTIVLCLAVMAVLALTTSRAEESITSRQEASTIEMYANELEGQTFLARLDAALAASPTVAAALDSLDLPEGATFENGVLKVAFEQPGGRRLDIEVSIPNKSGYQVIAWRASTEWNEDDPDVIFWSSS